MPDFTAKSPLTFMICDGMDHNHDSMQMTPDQMMHMSPEMHAHMHHHGMAHQHAKVCPFSVGGVYSTVDIEIPVVPPFVFNQPEPSEYVIQLLAKLVISSASSPRSPPVFS